MVKVLVWGSGGYYLQRKKWIPKNYVITAFIHGDSGMAGTLFEGVKMITPDEIHAQEYEKIIIAVKNNHIILKKLQELGIGDDKIEILSNSNSEYLFPEIQNIDRQIVDTYWCDFANVGDQLNVFMMDKLFNVKVKFREYIKAELLAIGSNLDVLIEGHYDGNSGDISQNVIHIWGAGFMRQYGVENRFSRPISVCALRGELSRRQASEVLGEEIRCPLGDGGLLVSMLGINEEKRYEIGIIPHCSEINDPTVNALFASYSNATIINVKEEPYEVLKKIAQCKTVISSSLHGLVIADSFRIPNCWIRISEHFDRFKFRDYYSAFDLDIDPFYCRDGKVLEINNIIDKYQITDEMVSIKQRELINAFPFGK